MRIAVNYFAFEAFRSKVSLNGEVVFVSVKKASYKRTVNRKHPCRNECIWLVCLLTGHIYQTRFRMLKIPG